MRINRTGWGPALGKFVVLLILVTSSGGCSLLRSSLASLKSTDHFVPQAADQRVLAEPGAEDVASTVANELTATIATVEREQYRPFKEPVAVYVTKDEESFAAFTGVPKQVRGAIITKLFLSGGLRQEPERIKRILTHEMSHLHLAQQLGIYGYNANLPSWFQEGLAVVVSGGGGAEKVSDAEAAKAILTGKCLQPEASGSFIFRKLPHTYDIAPHMFYRQSGMFAAYLRQLDEARFRTFLLAIQDGQIFAMAFSAAFGTGVAMAWQQFVAQLN